MNRLIIITITIIIIIIVIILIIIIVTGGGILKIPNIIGGLPGNSRKDAKRIYYSEGSSLGSCCYWC